MLCRRVNGRAKRRIAVENFLFSVPPSATLARIYANLTPDAQPYLWNVATVDKAGVLFPAVEFDRQPIYERSRPGIWRGSGRTCGQVRPLVPYARRRTM